MIICGCFYRHKNHVFWCLFSLSLSTSALIPRCVLRAGAQTLWSLEVTSCWGLWLLAGLLIWPELSLSNAPAMREGERSTTAACPFFQRWYTLFLTLSFCKSSLLNQANLIPSWLTFWHLGKVCSSTLKISFLKYVQPSWASLVFNGCFPGNFLNQCPE